MQTHHKVGEDGHGDKNGDDVRDFLPRLRRYPEGDQSHGRHEEYGSHHDHNVEGGAPFGDQPTVDISVDGSLTLEALCLVETQLISGNYRIFSTC